MEGSMKKLLSIILLALLPMLALSQATIPNYTACPCQTITGTVSWPNTAVTQMVVSSPAGFTSLPIPPNSTTFSLVASCSSNGNSIFTATVNGVGLNGAVSQTVGFNVNVIPPAPLSLTNQAAYCYNSTATITAPLGGNYYTLSGSSPSQTFANIITFGPLTPQSAGVYTVTSVGTCTAFGTTTISVAPNSQLSINSNSSVCFGQSVALTSTVTNGNSYTWYDPYGANISSQASFTLSNLTPTASGVYSAQACFPFGTIPCCPANATTQITVVNTDPVNISASPSSTICQGSNLSLIATAGNANVISWTGPGSFGPISGQSQTLTNVSTSAAGNYTVVAWFFGSNISCSTSAVRDVSVVPVNIPQVSFSNLNGGNSVCQNGQVTIQANVASNNFVNSYTWVGPGFGTSNPIGATQQLYTVQPTASGLYYVTAKFSLPSAPATTCAASNSIQLNVVPVNSISIIPPSPVCQPNNAYLQASAVGANSYQWVGPNNFLSPGSNVTVYFPKPSASGIYTVTASFNGGNITCTNTETVQLNVYPIMQFTLIPRQQVCYNTSVTVEGPVGASGYSWTSSNGFKSNDRVLSFPSIQPKNTGSYTLNISLGPCITTNSTVIDVLDPIQFTLTPSNRTVCSGDSVFVEIGASLGSENYAYVWSPSSFLQDPTWNKQVAIPKGTVAYNVTAHDIACPNYFITHSFTLDVKQPPIPDLKVPTNQGCVPLCMDYDAQTSKDAFLTTYDFGGVRQLQADSGRLAKYCLNEPGTYTLNIISKGYNGCTGYYTYPYPIVVDSKPGSGINWSPETPNSVEDVTFSPVYSQTPAVRHSWFFQGGVPTSIDTSWQKTQASLDSSNIANPIRKYESLGTYPVVLISTSESGCTDTVVRFMQVIDNLAIFIPNSFTPNGDGVNDYFGVKGAGIKKEGFTFEVMDRWGKPIFFTRDPEQGWDGLIKGQKAGDGVYVYRIRLIGMNGEGRRELVGYFSLYK